MKINRTLEDLNKELDEQIYLLESSMINFDHGHFEEAKRMAASLRVLLHDTGTSHSLLEQLGVKSRLWFYDVARNYDGKNLLFDALLLDTLSPRMLIGPSTPIKQFTDWWNLQTVISTRGIQPKTYTRKHLVLWLANQDGGAHVGEKIDQEYFKMTRENKGGWFLSDGKNELPIGNDRIKLSLRTIAFEVCVTLHRANSSLRFRTLIDGEQPYK